MIYHDAIAARVRQDRKAGTPGPWKCGNNNPTRVTREGRYIANFDPLHSNAPKCEIDARRAAHMPDLEAAYLDLYDDRARIAAEWAETSQRNYQRAKAAEAERAAEWNRRRQAEASRDLEKAVCATLKAERDALRAALESIANNTCCDGCQEDALVARQVLKGDDQ